MFTGIVKEVGVLSKIVTNTEGQRMFIQSKKLIEDMQIDDSVSVDGVCQTVVGVEGNRFEVQCVHTTLEKTTFKKYQVGTEVNLELPLRFNEPLGGHLVQGHVNGVSIVDSMKERGENVEITFEVEGELFRYMIKEGSVAINGVSLTISDMKPDEKKFTVSIIPHTLSITNFSNLKKGDEVNVEVDMMAKYVEKILLSRKDVFQ